MLTAIDAADDFALAAEKFKRSFAPDFELPTTFQHGSGVEEATGPDGDLAPATGADDLITRRQKDTDESGRQENLSGDSGLDGPDQPDDVPRGVIYDGTPDIPELGQSCSMGGSFTRDRALALQKRKTEELKNALKGEIAPDTDGDDSSGVEERGQDTGGWSLWNVAGSRSIPSNERLEAALRADDGVPSTSIPPDRSRNHLLTPRAAPSVRRAAGPA